MPNYPSDHFTKVTHTDQNVGSEEHKEVQAVNQFSLCLFKYLKAIVNGAIQSEKIQGQNILCLEDCCCIDE